MWSAILSTKCCATCINWGGSRKVGSLSVETEHTDTRGKCYAGVSCVSSNGHPACNGHNCHKYQKIGK